ncbi:MAG: hypothetical protein LRY28_05410 [Erysipelotrichaceae bacterium]|nr:hypothetical protein [Erysipelotrichaceae bacterium]
MTITDLLKQNRKQFIFYMIGAFLTTLNGLFSTFALSNAFGIIEEADWNGIRTRILLVVIFAFTPIFVQMLIRFLRMRIHERHLDSSQNLSVSKDHESYV